MSLTIKRTIKRTMKCTPRAALLLTMAMTLAGCAGPLYKDMQNNVATAVDLSDSAMQTSILPKGRNPTATESEKFWVSKTAVLIKDDNFPEVFSRNLDLGIAPRASLRDVAGLLSRDTGIRFSFAEDVQADTESALLVAGYKKQTTLKNFLDQVCAMVNPAISWQYKDGQVELFRRETRRFKLNLPTSDLDFTADISNKNQSGSGASGSSTSASTATSTVSTGQVIKMESRIKLWESVEKEIKQMLSKASKDSLVVSKSTGSITVTDTPQVLNAVGAYIQELNDTALRRVLLNVQVISVTRSTGDSFGVNWNAVYGTLASKYGINLSSPVAPGNFPTGPGTLSVVLQNVSKMWDTSSAVVSSLKSQGYTTSIATYPLWTLSGVPATTTVNTDNGYAAAVTVTQPTSTTGTPVQSITPGNATSGISIHGLPRVINATTIELEGAIEMSSTPTFSVWGPSGNQIQLPLQSRMSFLPVTTLTDGETLVYAGMESVESIIGGNGIVSAENENRVGNGTKTTFIVMVTPYLL